MRSRSRSRWLSWLVALLLGALALGEALAMPPPRASADVTRCQRARGRGRARPRRARAPRLTAAQRRQIQRWHARASASTVRAWSRADPPLLVLQPVGSGARATLTPETAEGGFDAEDLRRASEALAARSGAMHEIHPRLVALVYRAVRHFRAPYVHVISGYRDTARPTSRHAQGRAIDLVLPGVSDRRLASWARTLGFVGVGIYPTSGFVHLDVRSRSHFWSDSSGPGQPSRERPMLAAQVGRSDAAARRRGEEPTPELAEVETESESEPAETGEAEGG